MSGKRMLICIITLSALLLSVFQLGHAQQYPDFNNYSFEQYTNKYPGWNGDGNNRVFASPRCGEVGVRSNCYGRFHADSGLHGKSIVQFMANPYSGVHVASIYERLNAIQLVISARCKTLSGIRWQLLSNKYGYAHPDWHKVKTDPFKVPRDCDYLRFEVFFTSNSEFHVDNAKIELLN